MRWEVQPVPAEAVQQLGHALGCPPLLATLLHRAGATSPAEARALLEPRLAHLGDPFALQGMPEAVAVVEAALQAGETILLYGDYDVDGLTSVTLLADVLEALGGSVYTVIPHRLEEGYGLNAKTLARGLAQAEARLVLCVDCGTSSAAEIAALQAEGRKVVVLDHHLPKAGLPDADAFVNPQAHGEVEAPWHGLCAAGLAFKLAHALVKQRRSAGCSLAARLDLRAWLDLVALGTLADLVPLTLENRLLAARGLEALGNTRRAGLHALAQVAGVSLEAGVRSDDVAFRLAPRINAGGRLGDAAVPLELLRGRDRARCRQHAAALDALNRERQSLEATLAQEALAQAEGLPQQHSCVVYAADWHPGVVGIVASRLSQRLRRPVLVLGGDGSGLAKGSGRSLAGVDLAAALGACRQHLTHWGGHAMAVGLTLDPEHLAQLRADLDAHLARTHPEGFPEAVLRISAQLDAADLVPELWDQVAQLAPYGTGHTEPVFLLQGVALEAVQPMGQEHLSFQIETSGCGRVRGVAWRMRAHAPPQGQPIDLAVRLETATWRGARQQRLCLVDWRRS